MPALTPMQVIQAYQIGAFPMADDGGEIAWFSPNPRCIIPLDGLRVSRSLRRTIRRREFDIRVNSDFDAVIAECADRPEGTWISAEIMDLYRILHRRGFAHSVEAWRDEKLVGGLYGVAIGGAFFGESMFTRATDASKVALAALVERMSRRGYVLLDTQWSTPHLESLGAIEIPRREYLRRLRLALALPAHFADA